MPLPLINAAVFTAVALLHGMRLAYQSEVIIGGISLPLWLSAIAIVGAATLAWLNWRAAPQRDLAAFAGYIQALIVIDAVILLYSWAANLSYWGISGAAFLGFFVLDCVLFGALAAYRSRVKR